MPFLSILLLAASAAAQPPQMPLDLVPLESVIQDETRAVEAAYAFDQFQREMIAWDTRLAQTYARQEAVLMQDMVQQRLQSRIDTVGQAYELVLSHYPRNARALNHYGSFLYDIRRDIAKALNLWHLAARQDPDYGNPLNNLGLHYIHEGNYERGMQYLERALKLDPNNPDFNYNVVQVLLVHFHALERQFDFDKRKLYREAMKLSEKAAKLAPDEYAFAEDYATNFYAGERFGVRVDWRKAAAAWQRARVIAPTPEGVFYCWLNEGRVWIRANRPERAREALREALALNPESAATLNLLAELDD